MSEMGCGEIAKALAAVQASMPRVKKSRTARIDTQKGSYSYQYADLSDVMHELLPALSKHGLALTQSYSNGDGTLYLTTSLLHQSGERIDSMLPVATGFARPQELGSAMTYMRRYAITALVGIAAEDDDDGASGGGVDAGPPPRVREGSGGDLARYAQGVPRKAAEGPRAAPLAPDALANEKQRRLIWQRTKEMGAKLGVTDADAAEALKRVCADLGFESRSQITAKSVDAILHAIAGWTLATFGEPEPAEQIESGDAPVPF